MNMSDRIHGLRKAKGISQEELADAVGVSRQAVSKWESEQSVPDIDRVIIMSEYFGVTTDYILKGVENEKQQDAERKANAMVFVIASTVLNFIGLVVASAMWYEKQTATALIVGLVFMALGCMVFGIGMLDARSDTKEKAKHIFWTINIWLLCFIPLSFCYNVLFARTAAPYPIVRSSMAAYLAFWLVYGTVCIGVTAAQVRKIRGR
ncbi:helix-turn-helix domain-containing protein [Eubacteriales bacterium OttesenSCG-928-A19]|nr:helix-turn-helix domain-containing protein [Eubacteriales bacterium OttesenSCG-928-A19]